jgi:hypothetical protein
MELSSLLAVAFAAFFGVSFNVLVGIVHLQFVSPLLYGVKPALFRAEVTLRYPYQSSLDGTTITCSGIITYRLMRDPCHYSLSGFSVVLAILPRTRAVVGWSTKGLTLNSVALNEPRILAAPGAPGINAGWAIAVLAVPYQAFHRYPSWNDCPTRVIAAVAVILSVAFHAGAVLPAPITTALMDKAACRADPA